MDLPNPRAGCRGFVLLGPRQIDLVAQKTTPWLTPWNMSNLQILKNIEACQALKASFINTLTPKNAMRAVSGTRRTAAASAALSLQKGFENVKALPFSVSRCRSKGDRVHFTGVRPFRDGGETTSGVEMVG